MTVPHGQCSGTTGESAVIIHPGEGGSCAVCKEEEAEDDRRKDSQKSDSFSDDEIVSVYSKYNYAVPTSAYVVYCVYVHK